MVNHSTNKTKQNKQTNKKKTPLLLSYPFDDCNTLGNDDGHFYFFFFLMSGKDAKGMSL